MLDDLPEEVTVVVSLILTLSQQAPTGVFQVLFRVIDEPQRAANLNPGSSSATWSGPWPPPQAEG